MKIPNKGTIKYSTLHIGLILGAIGWGMSFIFSIISWETCMNILEYLGFPSIQYHPLLNYGFKMTTTIFGCIGILFLLCAMKTQKYVNLLAYLGIFSIFVGVISLLLIFQNDLAASYGIIIYGDAAFCFFTGGLILLSLEKA